MIVVEHEYKGTPPETNITVEGVEYVMAKAGKIENEKYTVSYRAKKAMELKKKKEKEANEALREDIASRGGYKTKYNEKPYKEYNKKVLSGRHIKLVSEDSPSIRERTKKQQHRLNVARYKSDEAFFWACIIDQLAPDEQRTVDVLYKSYLRSSVGGVSRSVYKNVNTEYPTGERRAKYVSYDTSKESYSVQRRINGKNIKYLTVKDYQTAINKAQELFPEDFCYY